jgi:tryptophan halogenase
VYCSSFISDDAAREEFLRKNPKVDPADTKVVKFRSGRHARCWGGNVVGVGNAVGFVEPLESSALQVLSIQCSTLADGLIDSLCEPSPSLIKLYNRYNGAVWDDVRNFLSIHYKFNHLYETPFWKTATGDVALHGAADIVEWYQENGPSVLAGVTLVHESNAYRMDGFMTLLTGQAVPYKKVWDPPPAEREFWRKHRALWVAEAKKAMTSEEVLTMLRRPDLNWG